MLTIPPSAKGRPVYRGLLVPYTVLWIDGKPDFRITDERAVRRCVTERRCGLCAKSLRTFGVFIGGDKSMASRMFTDPAMHELCARYAYSVCPYLNGTLHDMTKPGVVEDAVKHVGVVLAKAVCPIRPDRFGLLFAERWKLLASPEGVYIQASHGRIEWLPNPEKI